MLIEAERLHFLRQEFGTAHETLTWVRKELDKCNKETVADTGPKVLRALVRYGDAGNTGDEEALPLWPVIDLVRKWGMECEKEYQDDLFYPDLESDYFLPVDPIGFDDGWKVFYLVDSEIDPTSVALRAGRNVNPGQEVELMWISMTTANDVRRAVDASVTLFGSGGGELVIHSWKSRKRSSLSDTFQRAINYLQASITVLDVAQVLLDSQWAADTGRSLEEDRDDTPQPPPVPQVKLAKVRDRLLWAIWTEADWSRRPLPRARIDDVVLEAWGDACKKSTSLRSTLSRINDDCSKNIPPIRLTLASEGDWITIDYRP